MGFVRKMWKLKQVKIGVAVICVLAVLAAAFFLAPGAKKRPASGSVSSGPDRQTSHSSSSRTEITSSKEAEQPESTASVMSSNSVSSDTVSKDKYQTDPTPSGKPAPVEPENVTVDKNKTHTAALSIRCDTILNNMDLFNKDKLSVLPEDGTILQKMTVTFNEGESVFDVLKRVTREYRIHMEFKWTPIYNSVYVQGIHNLYEFDCGNLSGWMYCVTPRDGERWFPNYGASRYTLKDGDVIEWIYTCDLGRDIGGGYAVGGNADSE